MHDDDSELLKLLDASTTSVRSVRTKATSGILPPSDAPRPPPPSFYIARYLAAFGRPFRRHARP